MNKTDSLIITETLFERLNPSSWPFKLQDLPIGSALVGGSIRDGLLNSLKNKPDLDLVVPDNAIGLAQKLANRLDGTFVVLDKERDIARLVVKDWSIDFAKRVGNNLLDDLSRRDYTINSIALILGSQPELLDPFNGIDDLRERNLVAVSEKNLIDDPLRILRGFRLISHLNLVLDLKTKNLLEAHSKLLCKVSPERIKNEIQKLIVGAWADDVIPLVEEVGLLNPWSNKSKVFISQLTFLRDAKNFNSEELTIALPFSRLVHLLSDQGLITLKFSKKEIQICKLLRKWQQRNDGFGFRSLKESDLFKLHIELENHLPALILALSEKDRNQWLMRWRDKNDPLFHPSSPLDGSSLKRILGVKEGPIIGQILEDLSREKAFNRLHKYEDAVQLARNLWKQKQPLL